MWEWRQGSLRFLQWNRQLVIGTTFDAQGFASIPTDRPIAVEASLVPPILGAVNAFQGDYAQKFGPRL